MLRSLVAAFVALAATTSAFTVSPLASSHHSGAAAAHAGRTAPLSMADNNADKIRYVRNVDWLKLCAFMNGEYSTPLISGHIMCSCVREMCKVHHKPRRAS